MITNNAKKELMKLILFLMPILISSQIVFSMDLSQGKNWQESIIYFKEDIDKSTYALIDAQYSSFTQGTAPKIADSVIKSIPIIECHEQLVDIKNSSHPRITMLPKPASAFPSPDCHSPFEAASKIRFTLFLKLEAMIKQLDSYASKFGYQKGQIAIKVFEGLRDIKTQQFIFDNKSKEIRTANPEMNEDEVFNETCKWVSPVLNNVPVHSTGGAVDIRLWDNKALKFLDLGIFGVIWGKNTTAPTFSGEITELQRNNRLYLLIAATQAGLVNYLYEYWHFSYGDRYASFWKEPQPEKRNAQYGSI